MINDASAFAESRVPAGMRDPLKSRANNVQSEVLRMQTRLGSQAGTAPATHRHSHRHLPHVLCCSMTFVRGSTVHTLWPQTLWIHSSMYCTGEMRISLEKEQRLCHQKNISRATFVTRLAV